MLFFFVPLLSTHFCAKEKAESEEQKKKEAINNNKSPKVACIYLGKINKRKKGDFLSGNIPKLFVMWTSPFMSKSMLQLYWSSKNQDHKLP